MRIPTFTHNEDPVVQRIECGDAEYEISIPDGEILNASGKISKFKLKQAQKYIKDNPAFFAEGWNKYTNGIKISA